MDAGLSAGQPADSSGRGIRAMKNSLDWLRISIHFLGLFPIAELALHWAQDQLSANPIQWVEQFFGHAALNLLVLSLAVTPLVTLTGWSNLNRHRRTLGLYAFTYFALHFLTFAGLDYGFDWREIVRLVAEKPFILVGALAGLLLLALATTSFRYWMKRLGKNWKRLHKAVYLASGLVILHYAWALKGSLTTLSGDISRPAAMGVIVGLLLALRLPPIRRWVAARRQSSRMP